MEEMHGEYKVYVHVNKINGKIYIGQTKQTLEQRYKNGYEHCRHFWNAIQKYGWDNFEHIILVDNLSIDMANIIEEELIKKYNTTNHNNGYNMKSGGLNHIPSEETRKLMSKAHKGEKHWNYGKHWGDDFKKKLSEIHTGREITPEWRKNMSKAQKKREKFSKETKEKIRISKLGSKNPMYGGIYHVLQYDFDGIFIKEWESVKCASEEYNVSRSSISACCNGKIKSCSGYIWRYKKNDCIEQKIKPYPYKKNIKDDNKNISNSTNRGKKIYQYTKDGYYVKEFKSAKDVEKNTGIKVYGIQRCCRGELYTFCGYRWSYEKFEKLEYLKDTNYYKGEMIPVVQFDTEWNFIKEWDSATEVKRKLNIDQSSIRRSCIGKQALAGGFRWKYKTDCKDLI